jgi:hypothetical protein
VRQQVHPLPSQADLEEATAGKDAAEEELRHALLASNREYQAVGTARWFRQRRAKGFIPVDDAA